MERRRVREKGTGRGLMKRLLTQRDREKAISGAKQLNRGATLEFTSQLAPQSSDSQFPMDTCLRDPSRCAELDPGLNLEPHVMRVGII